MKQSIALSMNPLVKVAAALIVGMALGRYALSVVPLWGWFAVAILCLAVEFLIGHCFSRWLRVVGCLWQMLKWTCRNRFPQNHCATMLYC